MQNQKKEVKGTCAGVSEADAQYDKKESKKGLQEVNVRLRLTPGETKFSTWEISCPDDAVSILADVLKELDREMVCVVNLDAKHCPINYSIVSIGGITKSLLNTSDVLKSTILSNAPAIMLLHNHPSGDLTPSKDDLKITKTLNIASSLLGINLIDHVIVAGETGKRYSFFENGLILKDEANQYIVDLDKANEEIYFLTKEKKILENAVEELSELIRR